MRILVFSNFPPYVLGGAENQVARLVGAWMHSGNIVEVAGHRIPTTKVTVEGYQVKTHRIRTFNRAGRFGRALTYLISTFLLLIRHRSKFDIIYCRGMGDAAISVALAKALRISRVPLVACPINAKGKGDANFIKSIPGWRLIVRLLNRYCNAVNIIAPAITDDLNNLKINIPLMASIPNGIPVQPWLPSKSERSPGRIIFTGRLSHQKGLDLLISALDRLRQRGYKFHLDIFGDGPLKSELETLIENLALGGCIHLRGKVPAGEIRSLLVQYNALVLPSRYEGMSNSALEAMEAGIPVLATRCGGIDNYIDSLKGWLCEPQDLDSLTDSLRLVLETPPDQLASMGARARTMVENEFDIEIIARRNIALMKLATGSKVTPQRIKVPRVLVITKRQYTQKDLIDDQFGRLWEIPKHLSKNNFNVKGICLSYQTKDSGSVSSDGVVWQSINLGLFKIFGFLRFVLAVYGESKRSDIIIAFSDSIYGIMGCLISRFQSKLFVFDLYDNFEDYFFAKLPLLKQMYTWAIRKSDIVLCVSRPLYKLVKTYGRKKETHVIENAIPETMFFKMNKTRCRRRFNLPGQADLVGTVGALRTNRNIQVLFEAFNQLQEANPNLHLVVAGPRNIRIPRDQKIHDFGIISYQDVPALLNTLDVAIVCNKDNGFGNYCFPQKAREIMACAVPILAADIGAMGEYLSQHPECLFIYDDPYDLSRKIQNMLKNRITYQEKIITWREATQRLIKILNQPTELIL